MDGLLINSETVAHKVFQEVCLAYGGTFTNQIHSNILGTESDYWSRYIVEQCGLLIDKEHFKQEFYIRFRNILNKEIDFMPGAKDLLSWVSSRGYKKCLVTSSNSENASINLELLGISSYFDIRVTAEVSPKGKPEPDPYLLGANLIQCMPSDCIVFEDSSSGTVSGKRANCTVIAVPTAFAERKGFDEADYVLESLEGVIEVLEGLGM